MSEETTDHLSNDRVCCENIQAVAQSLNGDLRFLARAKIACPTYTVLTRRLQKTAETSLTFDSY